MPDSPSAGGERLQRTPLPAFLVRRWVSDAALPLYLQMSAYGYRRVPAAYKIWRFHWIRPLFLPLLFPAAYFYMGAGHAPAASSSNLSLYLGGAFLFLAFFIPGCGLAVPSPFPLWLANTARRGFLRDLAVSRLLPSEILDAHALARTIPTTIFAFCLAEMFYAMAVAEASLGKPNYFNYLALHCVGAGMMAAGLFQEATNYACASRHGSSVGWWVWEGVTRSLPLGAVAAAAGALIPSGALYALFRAFWPNMPAPARDVAMFAFSAPAALAVAAWLGWRLYRASRPAVEKAWDRMVVEAGAGLDGGE